MKTPENYIDEKGIQFKRPVRDYNLTVCAMLDYAEEQYGGKLTDEQLQNSHLQGLVDDLRIQLQFAEHHATELAEEKDKYYDLYMETLEKLDKLADQVTSPDYDGSGV